MLCRQQIHESSHLYHQLPVKIIKFRESSLEPSFKSYSAPASCLQSLSSAHFFNRKWNSDTWLSCTGSQWSRGSKIQQQQWCDWCETSEKTKFEHSSSKLSSGLQCFLLIVDLENHEKYLQVHSGSHQYARSYDQLLENEVK